MFHATAHAFSAAAKQQRKSGGDDQQRLRALTNSTHHALSIGHPVEQIS
jgi:hypothetical protein